MFNFFKKSQTKSPMTQERVQAMLESMMVDGQPLAQFVDKLALVGERLDIQMKIPPSLDTQALEARYHELQQVLYPLGVHEVNMNVAVLSEAAPEPTKSAVQTHTPAANSIPAATTEAAPAKAATKQSELAAHPRIANIVVVASGKGGVGKSTTTVNIALALQRMGKQVGILDADIYGPSIPTMLGVAGQKPTVENDQFVPIDAQGLAILSIGNLLQSDETPVAWRGIKATGALMQLYNQTNWPNLDYLLIDMPPGTGDIQLTLAQRIPVNGAVVVTTPQHIALLDAQKGIEMFYKTDIPVLGVVENMALHTCSQCGHTEAIFGSGGGDEMAARYQVPLLGQLPLVADIRKQMDQGQPKDIRADIARHYDAIAQKIDGRVDQFAKKPNKRFF